MTPAFVEVEGASLEYLDIPARDSGRPELLLLHEGLGSVSMWRDFPAALAAATGCRAIAYSRHGFGRSSPRTHPVTPRFMHEEALATLPAIRGALAIEHPILVGHSTGASMALLHAAGGRWPVAGVVAMAPLVFVEESNLATIRQARDAYGPGAWRERLARHHDDVDRMFHDWSGIWLDPSFRDWSIVAELAGLRCPVLAILGADDPYSSPSQVVAIAASAGKTASIEILRIAACGHAPHRERADVVVPAVARFVDSASRGPGKGHFER